MDWIIVCILTVLFSSGAFSYPTPVDLDGKLHRWPITSEAPEVYFEVAGDESLLSFLTEISQEAADTWGSIEQSMLKVKPANTDHVAQITINFQTSIAGGDMAAGYSIFDQVNEGVPIHCTITIAADPSADTYNLTKTTIHEMGHCLGLGHSLIPESIMSYSLEKNSLTLSADDKAVISRLYPADGSNAMLAPGCSIQGQDKEIHSQTLFLAILLAPFAFFLAPKIMRFLVKN
jgi:hypothetical protein